MSATTPPSSNSAAAAATGASPDTTTAAATPAAIAGSQQQQHRINASPSLQLHGKGGPPLKATLPMSSVLRGAPIVASSRGGVFGALSPPGSTSSSSLRHISPPEYAVCGHRSPGSLNYTAVPRAAGAVSPHHRTQSPSTMRRTASLDALYLRPSVVFASPHHQQQQHPASSYLPHRMLSLSSAHCAVLQLDKSTQTLESYLEHQHRQQQQHATTAMATGQTASSAAGNEAPRIEKVLRQRLHHRSGGAITVMTVVGTQLGAGGAGEHSVSVQTLSPQHAKAIPVTIPARPNPTSGRPMRSSVEGLNQEIEKLVLQPDQPHTCRPETNLFSRGETPEGHRAPLVDLLHGGGGIGGAGCSGAGGDRRSVNTQTPSREFLSSDESQSTSPDDGASSSGTGASPRINRFLAREPPDGCEKVSLKLTEADQQTPLLFKPCVGFRLRPSLGSAFQPIVASSSRSIQVEDVQPRNVAGAGAVEDVAQGANVDADTGAQ